MKNLTRNAGYLVQKLQDLLLDERNILMHGDLSKLSHCAAQKYDLIDQLEDVDSIDIHAWRQVLRDLDRNKSLIKAALDGLEQVSVDILAAEHVAKRLTTYSAFGKKQEVVLNKTQQITRKA